VNQFLYRIQHGNLSVERIFLPPESSRSVDIVVCLLEPGSEMIVVQLLLKLIIEKATGSGIFFLCGL
jgi:hypothetical protein